MQSARYAPLIRSGEDEEMAESTTTPRRTRAATAKTPATKPAVKPATKPAPKADEAPASTEPLKVELIHEGTTKTYEKFGFDPNLRGTLVGNVYAPLGTARVLIAVVPGEEAPAE